MNKARTKVKKIGSGGGGVTTVIALRDGMPEDAVLPQKEVMEARCLFSSHQVRNESIRRQEHWLKGNVPQSSQWFLQGS